MSNKCKITIKDIEIIIKLLDTKTSQKIWDKLPYQSTIKKWGKEIYFEIDVNADLERNSKKIITSGEIVFWPAGKCIAIGYGRTPISISNEIRLADNCNVWGITNSDLNNLDYLNDDEEIFITKEYV
tara:strand:- start:44 stop:424 length:381 start_codon:yes stop_codon:yes gene_type:complete